MRRVMIGSFQALRQHKQYCAMRFNKEEPSSASSELTAANPPRLLLFRLSPTRLKAADQQTRSDFQKLEAPTFTVASSEIQYSE